MSRLAPLALLWTVTLACDALAEDKLAGIDDPADLTKVIAESIDDAGKPFTLVVDLKLKEGAHGAFVKAFKVADAGTAKEPGNLVYQLNRSTSDPNAYMVYERWKNLKSIDAHLKEQYIIDLVEVLGDLLAEEPDFQIMQPLTD